MGDWKLPEAQRCLEEIIRRAESCGPQRVEGAEGGVVVLDGRDFTLLLAEAGLREADLCHGDDIPEAEPMGFAEFMQRSPLAEAVRTGEWPWEWDDATRTWVLPGDALSA